MPGADRRPAPARPCAGGACRGRRNRERVHRRRSGRGSDARPDRRRIGPAGPLHRGGRQSRRQRLRRRRGRAGAGGAHDRRQCPAHRRWRCGRSPTGCSPATTRVVALARKEDVLSAHPQGQRRFYRFRDGAFSNCNLYGLSRRGLALAETFREGGQFAKNPMRIGARLRLPQPPPPALRPRLARPRDEAPRPALRRAAPPPWCWRTAPMRSTSTMPGPTRSPPSFSTGGRPESISGGQEGRADG